MDAILRKSLKQLEWILSNIDTYPVYKSVSDVLAGNNVNAGVSKQILDTIQSETEQIKTMVGESKSWVLAILSDLNKKADQQ